MDKITINTYDKMAMEYDRETTEKILNLIKTGKTPGMPLFPRKI